MEAPRNSPIHFDLAQFDPFGGYRTHTSFHERGSGRSGVKTQATLWQGYLLAEPASSAVARANLQLIRASAIAESGWSPDIRHEIGLGPSCF